MPCYMKYGDIRIDGIDEDAFILTSGDGTSSPPVGWTYSNLKVEMETGYAQGEALVHIEAPVADPTADQLVFHGDGGSAAGDHNVEVVIKILDVRSEPPPIEATGWLLA